ncbi:PhzF family phenazine biosynthesis protein [bacterium]|nr:PhzF family phenazine biosynthesis protein [bacterium]
MALEIFQVDAFSDRPFRGNPAAVCVLEKYPADAWMQDVAAEMALSETAFLVRKGFAEYHLRWFTPTTEVNLCGHATLASAHMLYEAGHEPKDKRLTFHTRSGPLYVRKDGAWLEMDFPAVAPEPKQIPDEVCEALGIRAVYCGTGRSLDDDLFEVASAAEVEKMQPDFTALARTPSARGYIVTARGKAPYDFISRYFAPAQGIPEDPVTGSIHCALAPYWAAKLGKTEFLAYQASRRGGELRLKLTGDRVLIGGKAVTTVLGSLLA